MRIESYSDKTTSKRKGFGTVFKPGCVYGAQNPIPSLNEYLYGAEMSDHRYNLCHGDTPSPACRICTENENRGQSSIRQDLLQKSWTSDKVNIKLLDVVFSNKCNMACFMCGHDFSTFHAQEYHDLGWQNNKIETIDNTDIILQTLDQLVDLEQIAFIGGEFFIFPRNIELLEKAIEKNIGVRIVTNASQLSKKLLDKLQCINDIELQISAEGVEDSYEFMRYPGKWKRFANNVERLKTSLPWARINFHMVVQTLNIQNLFHTLEWNNIQVLQTVTFTLVQPEWLGWKILDNSEKISIVKYLDNNLNKFKITKQQKNYIESLKQSIRHSEFDQDLRNEFVYKMSRILHHRKVSKNIIAKQFGILENLYKQVEQEILLLETNIPLKVEY